MLTLSASGSTSSVVDNIEMVDKLHQAGRLHGKIFSITANLGSDTWRIGYKYHTVMQIKGRSKEDLEPRGTEGEMYLPLASTFEYSAMLFLEGLTELLTMDAEKMDQEKRVETITGIVKDTPAAIKDDLTKRLQENEELTVRFVDLLTQAVEKADEGRVLSGKRIYLFGLGQNNYVIRLFARRIQNMGFEVYVPGPRDIVSAARQDDICIFVSNSGTRGSMTRKIETAKKIGCRTVVVTANGESDLAKTADIAIPISSQFTTAHTADIMDKSEASRQARQLKRMFELAAIFYLEGASVALMEYLRMDLAGLKHVAKEWE